jgi:hypothetical protein
MVVYELYDGVYCRRIDNLEKEKEIRQKKEVRFFELYDIDVDLGEDVKLSEIKKHIHSSPELTDFEPALIKKVRKSGDVYVGRENVGKTAYVYFVRSS